MMIGFVSGTFGSKQKVWQTFMSHFGIPDIPEPAHQI
jgi:hypothetical protein